jgi:hypothetical protein
MRDQISLREGPAKWTGRLFASDGEGETPDCLFVSDEFDRKGQAHQAVIDYCLLHGLDHQAMSIEIVRWEGC